MLSWVLLEGFKGNSGLDANAVRHVGLLLVGVGLLRALALV